MSVKIPMRYHLLRLLADGRFHSGLVLGRKMGISRAAVWKHVRSLQDVGIEVYAVPGKGYRLPEAMELLDEKIITAYIHSHIRQNLKLEIFDEITSTNDYLMGQIPQNSGTPHVCFAEWQPQGRGRLGRRWITPYGDALACSLLWRFACPAGHLSGLSLAVGLMAIQALEDFGIRGVQLKWPNDILYKGQKLGGILIEVSGDAAGPCYCVIGIGINVNLSRTHAQQQMRAVDQPWIDLTSIISDNIVSRNQLAGLLIKHLFVVLPQFERDGFAAFLKDWQRYDALSGQMVSVQDHEHETIGKVLGVNESGSLLLDNGIQQLAIISGEVTVRLQ